MKVRWRGKTYIFGSKAKAAYRARAAAQADAFFKLAKLKPDASAPFDLQTELQNFNKLFSGPESPLSRPGVSPRERIIIVTSFLADQLKWCLVFKLGRIPSNSEMDEVFEGYGPLASFANRITVCSALGLIPDDMKGDLRTFKKIRNELAAHGFKPMSFDDPEVAAECSKLRTPQIIKTDYPSENERRFVASATLITATLAVLLYQSSLQARLLRDHHEEILQKSVAMWNDIMVKAGFPPMEASQAPPTGN